MSCLHHSRLSNQALVVIWRANDSEHSVSDRHDFTSQAKTKCSAQKKSGKAGAGKAQAYIYEKIEKPAEDGNYCFFPTATELPPRFLRAFQTQPKGVFPKVMVSLLPATGLNFGHCGCSGTVNALNPAASTAQIALCLKGPLFLTVSTVTFPVFVNISLFSNTAFVYLSPMKVISKHTDLLAC